MNNSFELISSMSPKIKNKLKSGERQFRRVAGASILALKRNIRRSSILDRSVNTIKNENLNVFESSSTMGTESFPSLQVKESQNNSIIIISDSDISLSPTHLEDKYIQYDPIKKTEVDSKVNFLLPDDKIAAISDWVTNIDAVNMENNTISSVFMELSTICGTDFDSEFLPKGKGHAINSTFANGHNKKFDEVFGQKYNFKLADEIVNSSENKTSELFKNAIIEDSFELLNQSLHTKLRIFERNDKHESEVLTTKSNASSDVETHLNNEESENMNNEDVVNESFKNLVIDESSKKKIDNDKTPLKKTFINKWKAVEISDDSRTDESITENMLDELYGNSWRKNKDLILSKTEPRKKVGRPDNISVTNSQCKPLLYKHLYMDSEKAKSKYSLNSNHKSKVESANSAYLAKVKGLSKNSINKKVPKQKLNFDESSDDNEDIDKGTKSTYFKTKDLYNKENIYNNVKTKSRNKTKKSESCDKISVVEKTQKPPKTLTVCNSTDSDEEFTPNKILQTSSKMKLNNITKRNNNKKPSSCSSENCGSNTSSDDHLKVSKTTKTTSKTTKSNKQLTLNDKSESKIGKQLSTKKISITSDDEWEDEVRGIERRLTIADDGTYSFLASLSANVPISKCDPSAGIFRNNYKAYKDQLLKKLFRLFNEKVFDNVLPHDMVLDWGGRIRKTAGFCYCKKITRSTGNIERSARIVLSTKVLDTAERLRDTLIHEMCHAATWIVSGVSDGHGHCWKSWAFKAMKIFPEIPPIKRCHNYVINTKYTYKCTGCSYSIGRHSKSLDIERKRCGHCYGKFEILINKTNKKGEIKAVAATPKKEATGFAAFVRENYSLHKNALLKHGDVMKTLAQKYKESPAAKTREEVNVIL